MVSVSASMSVCIGVRVGVQPAPHSTRSLTQQHCQLFPLNTTPYKPPQTPGEIVPPPDEVTHANEQ